MQYTDDGTPLQQMNPVDWSFGGSPAGFKERTIEPYFDTMLFEVSAEVPTKIKFFQGGGGGSTPKDDIYFNLELGSRSSLTNNYAVLGLLIEHDFVFAIGSDTGDQEYYQAFFDKFVRLRYSKKGTNYPGWRLAHLQRFAWKQNGGQIDQVVNQNRIFYPLAIPIEIPTGGDMEWWLDVPQGMTFAAASDNVLLRSRLASSKGFSIILELYCVALNAR